VKNKNLHILSKLALFEVKALVRITDSTILLSYFDNDEYPESKRKSILRYYSSSVAQHFNSA
jgi:hypothetical protein